MAVVLWDESKAPVPTLSISETLKSIGWLKKVARRVCGPAKKIWPDNNGTGEEDGQLDRVWDTWNEGGLAYRKVGRSSRAY